MYTSTALYPSLPPLHRGVGPGGGMGAPGPRGGYRDHHSPLIRSSTYSDYGPKIHHVGAPPHSHLPHPPPPMGPVASNSRFRDAFAAAKKQYGPVPGGSSGSPHQQSPFLRSMSMSPSRARPAAPDVGPVRQLIRESFQSSEPQGGRNGSGIGLGSRSRMGQSAQPMTRFTRLRSPSVAKERTRDDLIDSIIHTRTKEHRVMPGFLTASSWEERKQINIDCDKVYPGIFIANGETIQNLEYLRSVGVTHVLNTAERHVPVNPAKYPLHDISYFGFHVDDHPSSNISRFFTRTNEFIDEAVSRRGTVVVNCVMGWSRSATVVAAYLMSKKGMTSNEAVEAIRAHRPIRPNPGFLGQLAGYDNLIHKRLVW